MKNKYQLTTFVMILKLDSVEMGSLQQVLSNTTFCRIV